MLSSTSISLSRHQTQLVWPMGVMRLANGVRVFAKIANGYPSRGCFPMTD